MKILMLNYEFPPIGGGASPVTYYLCRELVKLGVEIDVITMNYTGLKKFEKIDGINLYRVPCLRSKKEICHTHEMFSYDISAFFFVLKLMKKNRYDINHTHFIIPCGLVSYLLKKFNGIPYVITSHGSDVPGYNPDRFSLQHKLLKSIWGRIVKNANQIITPSNDLKNLILRNIDTDNITVIPHGFYFEDFKPRKKQRKILLVSRLFKRKGFQYFLEAIKDLDMDYEINIIGDGPYKEELMKKAKEVKPKVNFVGWLDNRSQEYKKFFEESSIFVFPSSQESFGVVLQEAMAAECAIITSNITGCTEVVGNTGILVNPKNPGEIREALLMLIENDNLRERLGKKARKRVEEKFSWKEIASRYLNIYKDILE